MRCVAIRHDASTYMHERIVTERKATHEKRIRVGQALVSDPVAAPAVYYRRALRYPSRPI